MKLLHAVISKVPSVVGHDRTASGVLSTHAWLRNSNSEDVPPVEFTYLAFTRTPGESSRKRLRSSLLC